MASDGELSEYAAANVAELAALERKWTEGKLRHHVDVLLAFVAERRADILRLMGDQPGPVGWVEVIKQLIVELGCVHPKSEMRAQIDEIQREIWYRGEAGDHNVDQIKMEWTVKHAPQWREWLIKEYLFVADKCAGEIDSRLLHP